MCIERHFLVFCPRAYHTHRSRVLFHYIPLIIIIIAILIYELITNFFISCPQMNFNYSLFMCGYTCTVLSDRLGTFYAWVSVFTPTIITIIGCVLLPIRFIIQKRTLQQVQWHRARKMIIQTSAIASIYTMCWLPFAIILQLFINDFVSLSDPSIDRFLTIVPYITSLLTPLIVFHTIQQRRNPGIMEQIKRRFWPQRQAVVRPLNQFVAQQNNPFAHERHASDGHLKIVKNVVSYSLKSQ
jgi:heme exporter protein D